MSSFNSLRDKLKLLDNRFRILTFAGTMLPTIIALLIQFLTFALTARGLGIEQFGQYTALLAIVGVGVELVGLGGADLLVRAVSRDNSKFPIYYGNMLLLTGLTLPAVVVVSSAIAAWPMQSALHPLLIAMALTAEIATARISASLELVMVAHQHTVRAGWLRMGTAMSRLLLASCFFSLFGFGRLDNWICAVSAYSISICFIYLLLGKKLYGTPTWQVIRSELRSGTAFCINQTSRAAQGNLDRMILSRFATDAALGAYGAASRIVQLGLFPIQVVTRILYPKFFVQGAHGLAASRQFAIKVAPAMFGVGALSGAIVGCAALFVPALLGKDFMAARDMTLGLAFAMPFIALQYPAADALTGAGLQGLRAVIYGISAVGFGFIMIAGAAVDEVRGVIYGFVIGHLLLGATLWITTFVAKCPSAAASDIDQNQ